MLSRPRFGRLGRAVVVPLLAVLALLAAPSAHAAEPLVVHSTFSLDGLQEVPPIVVPGSGIGKVSIDVSTGQLSYEIRWENLTGSVTKAHLHGPAAAGVNGGVQLGLNAENDPIHGTAILSGPQVDDLLAGLWYIQIHTAAHPTGEIRGQLTPFTGPTVHAAFPLDGVQPVPPSGSAATGDAVVSLNRWTRLLRWSVTTAGLSGASTSAAFHGPAVAGATAASQIPLGAGNPAVGSATLTAAQADELLAGLWYVEIATAAFPLGEVRGQVAPVDGPVVLNELLYDADGGDDGKTFIELAGPPGASIGGWTVRGIEGNAASGCGAVNGGDLITLPTGTTIGPDGLFVIADASGGVTSVVCPPAHNGGLPDLIVADADFENGTESVQLLDPLGVVVDALVHLNDAEPLCATVDALGGGALLEGEPATDFGFGGVALTRWPTGHDTDDNQEDFVPNRVPSPGSHGEPRALIFDGPSSISLSAGGTVHYDIYTARPKSEYLLLVFLTEPTSPTLAGLAPDTMTNVFITLTLNPNFVVVKFHDDLDVDGRATATLALPPGLASIPTSLPLHLAALAPIDATTIVTNPVTTILDP